VTTPSVEIDEYNYSGLGVWQLDGTNVAANVLSAAPASGNITTVNTDLLIGAVGWNNSATCVATGSWTRRNYINYNGFAYGLAGFDILNAAPQTVQMAATLGSSQRWTCAVVGLTPMTLGPRPGLLIRGGNPPVDGSLWQLPGRGDVRG
jgi:hypothetical protein